MTQESKRLGKSDLAGFGGRSSLGGAPGNFIALKMCGCRSGWKIMEVTVTAFRMLKACSKRIGTMTAQTAGPAWAAHARNVHSNPGARR